MPGLGVGDGEPEVAQADTPHPGGGEDVRRLQIAMEHPHLVRRPKSLTELVHHVTHEPERKPDPERASPAPIELGEVESVDVLLDQVGGLVGVVVDPRVHRSHHARAGDAGHQPRLLEDARGARGSVEAQRLAAESLHDDRHAEHDVLGQPDVAHPPLAEAPPHLVVADACPERHA